MVMWRLPNAYTVHDGSSFFLFSFFWAKEKENKRKLELCINHGGRDSFWQITARSKRVIASQFFRFASEFRSFNRGVRRGVSKGVEDGRRLLALWAGHP
jgi:hypothetical protein